MIYKDAQGYPVNSTLDGMDSAMRAGVLGVFCTDPTIYPGDNRLAAYEIKPGLLTRHPTLPPANNPYNFTRDQMMCLVAAMPQPTAERVLYATLKRFCFAQDFERDIPGSTKYPFPNVYVNDQGAKTFTWFDFADPLFPHHVGHLILCAKCFWLYPFLVFSYPLLWLACLFPATISTAEQNQIQCMVVRAGRWWTRFYRNHNPLWEVQTINYWQSRNETEYSVYIVALIGKA